MTFSDDRFAEIDKRLGGPIVYVVHNDNEVIYIGSSVKGLARTFEGYHRHAAIISNPNTKVSIMFCDSEKQARNIEKELIQLHKPKENRIGYIDTRAYDQRIRESLELQAWIRKKREKIS